MDLTPLVLTGYQKILSALALLSFVTALTFKLLGYVDFAADLGSGALVGLIDTYIMFFGIRQCIRFEPLTAIEKMKGYRWLRRICVVVAVVVMLKLKSHALGLCVGFLLVHIGLIVILVFITRRSKKMSRM